VIDSDAKLAGVLPILAAAPWMAIDTEADSLHAYPEKLCLLQISIPDHDLLVDPLAPVALPPLLEEFRRHELILHGADYDLRLLYRTYGFVPSAIFDTMMASRLVGCTKFGLGDLVSQFLGITLEKGPQKANWARRPLTERMEAYARNDTRHLKPVALLLEQQLKEKGRLAWLREWCARLVAESCVPSTPDPDNVWRIKGSHLLDRRGLAVLRELWHWREQEAIGATLPPFFILNHERLIQIAEHAAADKPVELLVPPRFSPRRRGALMKSVTAGLAVPAAELPVIPRPVRHRHTEAQIRRFELIQRHRDQQAKALGIDPTLVASRATMLALSEDWDRHAPGLMRWQRELLEPKG
jgi:ribonuclease D